MILRQTFTRLRILDRMAIAEKFLSSFHLIMHRVADPLHIGSNNKITDYDVEDMGEFLKIHVNMSERYIKLVRKSNLRVSNYFDGMRSWFRDGLAVVQHHVNRSDWETYIDKDFNNPFGENARFAFAHPFSDGLASVTEQGYQYSRQPCYYIKRDGTPAFGELKFYECGDFSDGVAAVKGTKDGNVFYIGVDGERVFDEEFKRGGSFKNGVALVYDGKHYRYIDKKGKDAFGGRRFLHVGEIKLDDDLVMAEDESGTYVFNQVTGKDMFSGKRFARFDQPNENGVMIARDDRGKFAIDIHGNDLFGGKRYKSVSDFYGNLAAVTDEKTGKGYYIDTHGDDALGGLRFDKVSGFYKGHASVVFRRSVLGDEGFDEFSMDGDGNFVFWKWYLWRENLRKDLVELPSTYNFDFYIDKGKDIHKEYKRGDRKIHFEVRYVGKDGTLYDRNMEKLPEYLQLVDTGGVDLHCDRFE